jgi:hypothetical protein
MAGGCCFCLSPEPLGEKDLKHARGARLAKFVDYQNTFQVEMLDAPCSCSTCPRVPASRERSFPSARRGDGLSLTRVEARPREKSRRAEIGLETISG